MKISSANGAAPPCFFILVSESIGRNDGAFFDPHVYFDYETACGALDAYAARTFSDEDLACDEMKLRAHRNADRQGYSICLETSRGSTRHVFSLRMFTPAPASAPMIEAQE